MAEKVVIENMVNSTVSIILTSGAKKTWARKGAKISIDYEQLVESYYEPGIEYMFTHGILYTDNMAFKKEVGLESDEVEEPTNVIKLDDTRIKRIMSLMPLTQVKEELETLSYNQRKELADYVLEHPTEVKMDRIDIIGKSCGMDLFKAIELNKDKEE